MSSLDQDQTGGSEPVLSIIICTRNRADRLDGTLNSLKAIRSNAAWEAILVDNASTDSTAAILMAEVAADPRFRYLRVDRVGLGAGRDAALRVARGRIVSFTDDDCYLAPDYVDMILRAFDEHPDVGCIGGRILLYDASDARWTIDERNEPAEIAARTFVKAGALKGANLSFRRDVLLGCGGFDPALGAGTKYPCEDVDALAAVLWSGWKARFDPRPLVHHHHGRRASDVPRLLAGYDAGRGAYYAKYILRRDTRSAYVHGWWATVRGNSGFGSLTRLARELRFAAKYSVDNKRVGILIAAVPIALSWLAYSAARAAVHGLLRPGVRRRSASLT